MASLSEADAYLKAPNAKWTQSLSKSELEAVQVYSMAAHAHINATLRGQDKSDKGKELVDRFKPALDSALNKHSFDEDVVVYRGVDSPTMAKLKRGAIFVDKAFVSTAMHRRVAEGFSGLFEGAVLMEIHVRKGKAAAPVDGSSKYPHEREVLLPRNTRFKITGRKKVEDFIVLQAEVL